MKCVFCRYESGVAGEFFHMPWNDKIACCFNCAADISIAVRTKMVNGDLNMIKTMIRGLEARMKATEAKLHIRPIEIVPYKEEP